MKIVAFGGSAVLHVVVLTMTATILSRAVANPRRAAPERVRTTTAALPRLIFLAPRGAGSAGGGGGGGNRQAGPIRRAEDVGRDRATLRTRQAVATTGTFARSEVPTLAVLLDARPLASGDAAHPGLPTGGVSI